MINPHWILVDIEPSIALARAECLDKLRKSPAQKPVAFDVMKEARAARAMYQRDLLRRFVKFLASCLRLARAPRYHGLNYPTDLQPSMSVASPRGA